MNKINEYSFHTKDDMLNDINNKMQKLNGVFNFIDKVSDTIEAMSDKIASALSRSVSRIFKKKKNKEEI